jgi:transposase
MAFAGVDLHKSFCQAIVCTHEGNVLKEGRIPTEQEEIEEFFSGLECLEIALEATTTSEYFYDALKSLGHHVVVAHPLKTRMIADAKIKTDKRDARILAELLRSDLLPTAYVPPKEQRELRHLVRHRIALGRLRGGLKTRVKTELRRKNITYREGANCFTEKGKAEAIAEAGARYEAVRLLTSIKGSAYIPFRDGYLL